MRTFIRSILAGIILFPVSLLAQERPSPMSLTIDEALQVALENSMTLKNARQEIFLARRNYLENLAAGLPQVSGSASLNDNLKLMTQLIPAEFFGGEPGTYIPVQFGTKYNATYGIYASQMIFNGALYVGLKTLQLLEQLSQQSLEKSEMDLKKSVMSNYFLILISERSTDILESNMANLNRILLQTEKMQQVGMREETDVDKISVSVSMLENNRQSTDLNTELSYNLLRFQLGIDPDTPLKLTSSLDEIMTKYSSDLLLNQDFVIENHIDYRMLKTQEQVAERKLQVEKAAYLPTLSGFYSYSRMGMDNDLNFDSWYPTSMIGLQLDLPVFNSGIKYQKIKKAQIGIEMARTNMTMVSDQLRLTENQLRSNLRIAKDKFISQNENIEVAERIVRNTQKKYEQGMASVFDLIQANNDYLISEGDYLNAVLELLTAQMELDILLNNN
ncbi:MAG: TolC family protein [Bacteroidales bacterium]|nr:MAG: TolC family protein [Bacteroidales bacterium]